ncbi:MAG: rhomboid family intramembrane serine protease [Kiritimatiellia bacterium]
MWSSSILWRLRDVTGRIRNFFAAAPAVRWITFTFLAVFLIQCICQRVECVQGYSFTYLLWHCLGLCPDLFAAGFFWQALTYMFFHLNWMHLALNTSAVLLLGAGVEMEIGTRRFLRVFLLGGIVGGLAWVLCDLAAVRLAVGVTGLPAWLTVLVDGFVRNRAVTAENNTICLGASGGVFALVGACAALFPRRHMLLFLIWPVRTRRLAIVLGISTVFLAIYGGGHVAHLAHLAGGLAGYVYGRHLVTAGCGD